jgi:large subunit ribosomal protein L3
MVYEAVQLGFGAKKAKNITKSLKGHFKNLGNFRYVREFRLDKADREIINLNTGDTIDPSSFAAGDQVKLTGVSKGKGFAGVVKRHGFHGHNATHGTKDQLRMPGSIGAGGVQRVFKGKRMAGRMGGDQVTLPSVNILAVNAEAGEILIEGAVPGVPGSLVEIYGKGELESYPSQSQRLKPLLSLKKLLLSPKKSQSKLLPKLSLKKLQLPQLKLRQKKNPNNLSIKL